MTFGALLEAVRVAEPAATTDTAIVTLVELAAKVMVAGTVTTPVLLELKLTTSPLAGAGADRFNWALPDLMPEIVRLVGEKLSVAPTWTGWLAAV